MTNRFQLIHKALNKIYDQDITNIKNKIFLINLYDIFQGIY
jgi:hypothetical protein